MMLMAQTLTLVQAAFPRYPTVSYLVVKLKQCVTPILIAVKVIAALPTMKAMMLLIRIAGVKGD